MIKSIANNFLFCFIYLARDWSLAIKIPTFVLFCFVFCNPYITKKVLRNFHFKYIMIL